MKQFTFYGESARGIAPIGADTRDVHTIYINMYDDTQRLFYTALPCHAAPNTKKFLRVKEAVKAAYKRNWCYNVYDVDGEERKFWYTFRKGYAALPLAVFNVGVNVYLFIDAGNGNAFFDITESLNNYLYKDFCLLAAYALQNMEVDTPVPFNCQGIMGAAFNYPKESFCTLVEGGVLRNPYRSTLGMRRALSEHKEIARLQSLNTID